jgi:hypothetical protein
MLRNRIIWMWPQAKGIKSNSALISVVAKVNRTGSVFLLGYIRNFATLITGTLVFREIDILFRELLAKFRNQHLRTFEKLNKKYQ